MSVIDELDAINTEVRELVNNVEQKYTSSSRIDMLTLVLLKTISELCQRIINGCTEIAEETGYNSPLDTISDFQKLKVALEKPMETLTHFLSFHATIEDKKNSP